MDITLQYFEDCPNWRVAEERLREALRDLAGPEAVIRHQRVETPEEADRVGFAGSPTILIDGVDAFPDRTGPAGFACRMYGGDTAPTVAELRRVLKARDSTHALSSMPRNGPGLSLAEHASS